MSPRHQPWTLIICTPHISLNSTTAFRPIASHKRTPNREIIVNFSLWTVQPVPSNTVDSIISQRSFAQEMFLS